MSILKHYFYISLYFLLPLQVYSQADKWERVTLSDYENKKIRYSDFVYDPNVRTVQLYTLGGNTINKQLNLPITSLQKRVPILLEFDVFGDDADYYEAELVHCNRDWTPSELQPIEFMKDFNSFKLNDFDFSMNTRVPFVHFKFQLPSVQMSGNYIIKVYREGKKQDLIITKRFIVSEESASIGASVEDRIGGQRRYQQQINVLVNYRNLVSVNYKRDFSVCILQNGRWDNALENLKPRFIRGHENVLDYSYTNGENSFMGSNEFRVFETSSINGGGPSNSSTDVLKNFNRVRLHSDLVRNGKAFNQQQNDYNGGYVIHSFGKQEPWLESDYMEVVFNLKADAPFQGTVYAYGAFSEWQLNDEYKLLYDASKKAYVGSALLKQGRYDYMYTVLDNSQTKRDDRIIEGSFNLTKNIYNIIVYYRGPGDRADRVVAIKNINTNR
ncbi:type IX secretion system plug protein [Flammeovirga pacifica]|uniref:Type 9 secretion system plug protein N-terminal domain-containing protein n=1 Tax=Flammeovirga pacifica TaxID=915059 RepID=A0A1S1YW73_FLAPC|nr:type IX secretion system plug protein domain-containing protein [Flammeovirga pacifica]OHX65268.1 hypothetical protein NH26_02325 [Flammeovirga pacifica]